MYLRAELTDETQALKFAVTHPKAFGEFGFSFAFELCNQKGKHY